MLKRNFFLLALLSLGLMLAVSALTVAGQTSGLDIVIAIDTSASMQRSFGNNDYADNELGLRRLQENNILPFGGTDTNNLSYDTTNFINQWLADFVATQSNRYGTIDIRSSVITFNRQATPIFSNESLTDIESVTTVSLPSLSGERSTDFLNLYQELDTIFSNGSDNRQKAVFIITDSLPCNPSGNTSNDDANQIYVRERFCTSVDRMVNHVRVAGELLPTGVQQYIYFVGSETLWANTGTTDVRDAWEATADRSQGMFHSLASIDELPSIMFQDVLGLLTRAVRGGRVIDPTTIGVFQSQGQINVPPYQEFMDVILFLDAGETLPRFDSVNNNDISTRGLANSETGQLQRLRFNVPDSGLWQIRNFTGLAWVSYKPAQAQIQLERTNAPDIAATDLYRFEEVRVVYRLETAAGEALMDDANLPELSLSVNSPNGQAFDLEMTAGGNTFNSEPFVLAEAGNYRFEFQASPTWNDPSAANLETSASPEATAEADGANGANGASQRLFNFLSPAEPLGAAQVAPMNIIANFGTVEQAAQLQRTNIISIPRSLAVPFSLEAQVNDTAVAIPQGLSAELTLTGAGCLEAPELVAQGSSFIIAGGELNFEQGDCEVAYNVAYTSTLKPVVSETIAVVSSTSLGSVTATKTARLEVVLRNSQGEDIDQNSFNPSDVRDQTANVIHYEMNDVVSQPTIDTSGAINSWVTWQDDKLLIDLIFRDSETDDLLDPIFVNYAATSTATAEGELREDFPVPFEFSVVRLGGTENESLSNEAIRLLKNQRTGVYTLEISGLTAGDYELRFTILRDDPNFALDSDYEYSEEVLNTLSVGNPRLYAFLRVNANPLPTLQIQAAVAIVAALLLLIITLIALYINRTRGALSGNLVIYKIDGKNPLAAWQSALPPDKKKTNSYTFGAAQLLNQDTLAMNPEYLKIFTKGDSKLAKAGGAYVKIKVGDNNHDLKLELGVPTRVAEDSNYYLVKLDDAISNPKWEL